MRVVLDADLVSPLISVTSTEITYENIGFSEEGIDWSAIAVKSKLILPVSSVILSPLQISFSLFQFIGRHDQ